MDTLCTACQLEMYASLARYKDYICACGVIFELLNTDGDCICLSLVRAIMTDSADNHSGDGGNQDWRVTSGQRQIRQALDRGSVPQGVVMMQKEEVARVMRRIIDDWKPAKEVLVCHHFSLHLNIC